MCHALDKGRSPATICELGMMLVVRVRRDDTICTNTASTLITIATVFPIPIIISSITLRVLQAICRVIVVVVVRCVVVDVVANEFSFLVCLVAPALPIRCCFC